MMLMSRSLVPLAAMLALGLAGCSDKPSVEQCEKLLSHIVTIEVQSAADDAPGGARSDDLAEQKAEIEQYLGAEFIETCQATYSRERVVCALASGSYEELIICDEN